MLTGTRGVCNAELGVRFPPPPLGTPKSRSVARLAEGARWFSRDDVARIGEPGATRYFLNFWDDTPRPEAVPAALAEVRRLFEPPTPSYKTGIVFLAYLNGHQRHFRMVGGLESARSALHLSEVFRLADRAGLLREPDLAVERMRRVLALAGVGA